MFGQPLTRQTGLALVSVAATTLPSSCRQPGKSPPARESRVALMMKSLSNEFFVAMENGAKTHQKSNKGEYDLLANGIKDEQDVAAQITLPPNWVPDSMSAAPLPPTSLQ